MLSKLLTLVFLILSGCVNITESRLNNEVFNKSALKTVSITWVKFQNQINLKAACKKLNVKVYSSGYILMGCAKFNLTTKQCKILTLTPSYLGSENFKHIGHEVVHCFIGNFHGRWE